MIGLNVHGSDLLAAPDQTPRKKKRSGHRSTIMAGAESQRCPLWAPVPACLLNPKQAVDASSCPRPRAQLPYPGGRAGRPALGVSSVGASGRRGRAGAQRNGGPLCRAVPSRASSRTWRLTGARGVTTHEWG